MAGSVRQRSVNQTTTRPTDKSGEEHESKWEGKGYLRYGDLVWVVLISLSLSIIYLATVRDVTYPVPKTVADAVPGDFVEERARKHLNEIVKFGDRPVGSRENEEYTVEYLLKVLSKVKDNAKLAHNVDIDVQSISGSFKLHFMGRGSFTSAYDNVKNVLVKLSPKDGADDSVMINCHFDSVINATGASDDAVSCCLMLEVLRVVSSGNTALKHNVIFIFNGAEENILQASHGFITSHPWAKDIRAFINLEAAGAGGREILFQAGPENPWIVRTYADVVPHPFASVVGQELFESGLIPSDTDFRIFRDYGGIPGIDIAYISNGYVYHTKYDTPEMIPPGCIQRGGENLLALVEAMANSPLLRDPGQYRHGKLVFFDILGYFMIVYPFRIGTIVNFISVAVVILGIAKKLSKADADLSGVKYGGYLLSTMGLLFLSWLLTIITVDVMGLAIDYLGRPMMWFTHTWLLIGLYALPALAIFLSIHHFARRRMFSKLLPWDIESLYFDANLSVFAIILAMMTIQRLSSAVLVLLFVLVPLIVRDRTQQLASITGRERPVAFLIMHVLATLPGMTLMTYTVHNALVMFVPVMGRAGPAAIPDVFLGGLVAAAVVVTTSYHAGLVHVCRSLKRLLSVLFLLHVVCLVLAVLTPIGFPYGSDLAKPTKQRHIIHHMERTFHDTNGAIYQQDSGLLHLPFDRNSIRLLESEVPALKDAPSLACTEEAAYCGLPFYFPLLAMMTEFYYIPGPKPQVTPKAELQLVERSDVAEKRQRLTFAVTGPCHVNVYMSPREGSRLANWSLADGEPTPASMPSYVQRPHYFVFYSYGTKPEKPFEFWVDMEMDSDGAGEDGLLDIAIGAHYLTVDGVERHTPELRKYIETFPEWTVPIGWVATYEMWTF